MRSISEQVVALAQGFPDQAEITVFQVANSPVQHMGGRHAGTGAEIPPVDDQGIHALQGEIAECTDSVDPGTDDQDRYIGIFLDCFKCLSSILHQIESPKKKLGSSLRRSIMITFSSRIYFL